MARALRIERPGGRYHVAARGNEHIFRDHFHFLELLRQLGESFGVKVHAYVLMDNHYHLLLETSEANLSRAMHWLNARYKLLRLVQPVDAPLRGQLTAMQDQLSK